jgi:uncharacterized Zn finger protein (UPF0148 family)
MSHTRTSSDPDGPDTLTCTTCGEPSFAWLAEIFGCPVCGSDTYGNQHQNASTDDAEAVVELEAEREGEVDTEVAQGRKRKRKNSTCS